MNSADPRLIWKRLLRKVYSPRSASTAPTSVSASPATLTRSGPSVNSSTLASRDRTQVLRSTDRSTSTRRFSNSGDCAGKSSRWDAIEVSITLNSAGSPAPTSFLPLDSGR